MNKVTVLVEGFAKVNKDDSWEATSTCTLIESNGQKIIMDPGADRKLLSKALQEKKISPEQINWVFLSHRHLDHSSLLGFFPRAKTIDDELFQDGAHGAMHEAVIPGTEVAILKTPGHAPRHASLLVQTQEGVVVVAGDVFWFYDDQEQSLEVDLKDDFADGNMEDLKKSRRLLLEKADWIIPGHGKKMKVER